MYFCLIFYPSRLSFFFFCPCLFFFSFPAAPSVLFWFYLFIFHLHMIKPAALITNSASLCVLNPNLLILLLLLMIFHWWLILAYKVSSKAWLVKFTRHRNATRMKKKKHKMPKWTVIWDFGSLIFLSRWEQGKVLRMRTAKKLTFCPGRKSFDCLEKALPFGL